MADLEESFKQLPSSESIITDQKLSEELKDTKKTLAALKERLDEYPASTEIITEEIYKQKLLEISDSVNNIRKVFQNDLNAKYDPINEKVTKLQEDFNKLPDVTDIITDTLLTPRLRSVHEDLAKLNTKFDQLPKKEAIVTTTILTDTLKDHVDNLKEIFATELKNKFTPVKSIADTNAEKIQGVSDRVSDLEKIVKKDDSGYSGFGAD